MYPETYVLHTGGKACELSPAMMELVLVPQTAIAVFRRPPSVDPSQLLWSTAGAVQDGDRQA